MIEIPNVELLFFEDMLIDGEIVSKEKLFEMASRMPDVPIKIRVGAVKYDIGVINRFRSGANALTGDLYLQIRGRLVLTRKEDEPEPAFYEFIVDTS